MRETRNVSENDKAVVFNRTPIMSTYLLAFIVGEYDFVEDVDKNGIVVRVYTPVGKKEQGRFALEVCSVVVVVVVVSINEFCRLLLKQFHSTLIISAYRILCQKLILLRLLTLLLVILLLLILLLLLLFLIVLLL